MTKRMAKKVIRRWQQTMFTALYRYHTLTIERAMAKRWRCWCRYGIGAKLTPGYRYGRWDPQLPQNPSEPPF